MSDRIDMLPVDPNYQPSPMEMTVAKNLLEPYTPPIPTISVDQSKGMFNGLKDPLIGTGLFLVLCNPFVDEPLKKVSNIENPYYLLGLKALIFAVIFFVLSNLHLIRKN